MRARSGVEHAKALRNATEDFFTLTPNERSKIRNPAAWITDRYERGFEKLQPAALAKSNDARAVACRRSSVASGSDGVKKPQRLDDCTSDLGRLAFARAAGFHNATILPEGQP